MLIKLISTYQALQISESLITNELHLKEYIANKIKSTVQNSLFSNTAKNTTKKNFLNQPRNNKF